MTHWSLPGLALALAPLVAAGPKKMPGPVTASNDDVEIVATAITEHDAMRQALGTDPPPGIILVQVRVTPKDMKPLDVYGDDFVLLSHADGQKSGPFSPDQLAGGSVMVVKTAPGGGGSVASGSQGPVWAPPMGDGRPRQIDSNGGGMGNTGDSSGLATAEMHRDTKASPLLAVLKKKVLPDGATSKPESGLLYFPIDGKVKVKDLALIYQGRAGKLILEFNPKQAPLPDTDGR